LQFFPIAVHIEGKGYFQALFFYESMLNLIGCAFLLWFLIGKRRSAPGFVVSCYFMWYGLVRALLEMLRPAEFVLTLGPVPVSQLMSILIFLIGAVYLLSICYRARTEGKRIPIFLTRREWKKTGRPMYEWGRNPKAPFKKKAVPINEAEGEEKYWLVPETEGSGEEKPDGETAGVNADGKAAVKDTEADETSGGVNSAGKTSVGKTDGKAVIKDIETDETSGGEAAYADNTDKNPGTESKNNKKKRANGGAARIDNADITNNTDNKVTTDLEEG
jgi:hypothetical protein